MSSKQVIVESVYTLDSIPNAMVFDEFGNLYIVFSYCLMIFPAKQSTFTLQTNNLQQTNSNNLQSNNLQTNNLQSNNPNNKIKHIKMSQIDDDDDSPLDQIYELIYSKKTKSVIFLQSGSKVSRIMSLKIDTDELSVLATIDSSYQFCTLDDVSSLLMVYSIDENIGSTLGFDLNTHQEERVNEHLEKKILFSSDGCCVVKIYKYGWRELILTVDTELDRLNRFIAICKCLPLVDRQKVLYFCSLDSLDKLCHPRGEIVTIKSFENDSIRTISIDSEGSINVIVRNEVYRCKRVAAPSMKWVLTMFLLRIQRLLYKQSTRSFRIRALQQCILQCVGHDYLKPSEIDTIAQLPISSLSMKSIYQLFPDIHNPTIPCFVGLDNSHNQAVKSTLLTTNGKRKRNENETKS